MGTMAQSWLSFDQVVDLIWYGDPVLDPGIDPGF